MIDKSLVIIGDNASIPFLSLTSIINKTAQYYFEQGINSKKNVAILAYNSVEYVITIYALWKIGAVPVPINTRLNENEIIAMLPISNCSSIIIDKNLNVQIENVKQIKLDIKYEGKDFKSTTEPKPNDTAVIIHTSGSVGNPKAVEITNKNLYQSYTSISQTFGFSSSDIFIASLPFFHIGGFAIINRALLSGGTLVLPNSLKQIDIIEAIKKYNPTIISLVPTMLKRFIEQGIKPNSNLRHLFLGGGPSNDELIHSALDGGWKIVKVYGSSETTAMVTGAWGDNLKDNPATAGKPFIGVDVLIVNESMKRVGENIVGEITVKSSSIAKGYVNNKELWNKKYKHNFYFTGDFGFLDSDGNLFVVARRTDLIVSGGENIDPKEIETILNKHPDINESFVFPINDSEWGQVPVALIVLNHVSSLTEKDVFNYLKLKLSSYKKLKKIKFVETIPKTELGKIKIKDAKNLLT